MAAARYVKLEGVEDPCVLVSADGSIPEELVVEHSEKNDVVRRVVYRLQPSTASEERPVYVEVFDE